MQDRPPALVWGTRMFVALVAMTFLLTTLRSDRESAADVAHIDGSVWLVSPVTGRASLVNSATMEVTAEVKVANEGEPVEAVQFGSDALVLNRATGEIGRLDGALLSYGPTTSMEGSGADLEILAGGGQPYVLNAGEGWVRAIDPLTLNALGTADVTPGAISAVVADDGRLWVADRAAGQIKLIDETGLTDSADFGDPSQPISMVLANDRPHVVDPGNAEVVEVETDTLAAIDSVCLPATADNVLAAGSSAGTDPSTVFSIAPAAAGTTQLFVTDLDDRRCRTIDLAGSTGEFGQPVTSLGAAYVPVLNSGRVLVVTPTDNSEALRTVRVVPESERFELFVKDGRVWFNNRLGPEAGTIDATGRVLRVAKYDDGEPLFGSQASGDGGRIDDSLVGTAGDAGAAGTPADDGAPADDQPIEVPDPIGGSGDTIAGPDDDDPTTGTGQGDGDGTGGPAPDTRQQPSGDDTAQGDDAADDPFDPEFPDLTNDLTVLTPGEVTDEPDPDPDPEPTVDDPSPTTTLATDPPTTLQTLPTTSTTAPPRLPRTDTVDRSDVESTQANTRATPSEVTRDDGVVVTGARPSAPTVQIDSSPIIVNPTNTGPDRNAEIRAHFEISTSTVEVGQLIAFTDLSSGSPNSWTWDFGNGTSDSGREVQTSWDRSGTYTITLTVSDGRRSDSKTTSITVIDPASQTPPAANFTYTSATAEVGERITFRDRSAGRPTTWLWDWGDGETSSGSEATHDWDRAGSYTVRLTVGNDSGETQARFRVTIIDKVLQPTASFNLSSEIVTVEESISFSSTATGNPTNVIWDFGDGTSGIGDQVSHSYRRPGQYTARLTVSNSKGSDSFERNVVVRTPTQPPDARFTVSDTQVGVGTPVLFTDASIGSPNSIRWNFGDGTTGTGSSVSHAWSRPGAYQVRLTVRNEAGSADKIIAINVVEAVSRPVALFTRAPSGRVQIGESVSFVDQSQNEPTVWSWEFGDGRSSSDQNPVHRYRAAGTYAVTLTAGNERGQQSTTKTVVVQGGEVAPDAAFVFSPSSPAVGNEVAFEDRSSSNADTWLWDFGDGSTSTAQNPVYVYSTTGTFLVTLTAANGSGTESVQQPITVRSSNRPQPSGAFDWIPSRPRAGERVSFIDFTPGSVTTPIWTLPGGEVPSDPGERQIEYTFENSGTYEISMRVCWIEESNNCRLRTRTVRVGAPSAAPVAGFEIGGNILDQSTALRGDLVVFSDTSSGSDIGQPVWTIDGETFTGSEVERVFNNVGEFDVVLTIDNGVGSDSISRRVQVVDPTPPSAAFGVTTNPVDAGESVNFVDQSTGLIDTHEWDFGDGNTSTDATPRHTYARPGDYVISLTTTNQWGSDTTSRAIEITEPLGRPNPTITAVDPFGGGGELSRPIKTTTGQVIGLSDSSDDDAPTEWRWDFGDGNSGVGRQVSHFYTKAGTYEIVLTATNRSGSTTTTLTVTVS